MWKLRTHLTGLMVHGIIVLGYVDYHQYAHDSNLTMNLLLHTLWICRENLPRKLYIQMDNCTRENKNQWLFVLCALLVEMGIFDKIKVNF